MARKFLNIILAFCLSVLMLTACGRPDPVIESESESISSKVAAEMPDTSEMTAPKNTNKEISISVIAPDGWTKKDDDSSLIWYEKGSSYVSVIKPWIPNDAKSAMDVAKYEQQQIKDFFQEAQTSEPVETTLDGINAVRMELDMAISDTVSQKQVYIYFFVNNIAYKVMGTYLTDDASSAGDVESIIQSIKIK